MYTAAVITISDKGYRGERVDTSGPNLVQLLTDRDFDVTYTAIIPDDREMIKAELCKCADELGIALVLTTGGTGFSPRDITPEAAMEVIERPTPGLPDAMRAESMRITPKGCLRRSGYSRQRFHFHAGSAVTGNGGLDFHRYSFFVQRKIQIDAVHQNGVAHGDDVRGPLGAHDTGDLGHGQHVALLHATGADEGEGLLVHQHPACGHSHALGDRLLAHVHHFGPALFIKMGKIRHD